MEDLLIDQEQIEEGVLSESVEDNIRDYSTVSINKSVVKVDEIIGEEIKDNERSQDIQSDIFIFNSNVVDNSRSIESVALEGYESFLLFENVNPNSTQYYGNISLNDDINNYDLLSFTYKYSIDSNILNTVYLKVSDFKNSSNIYAFVTSNYKRIFQYSNDNTISLGPGMGLYDYSQSNDQIILLSIYGLDYEDLPIVNPDQPIVPSVSGNTIINNYYNTISCDTVSDNILYKKLNDYSTAESMAAIGVLMSLGVIFAVLCRKAVLRWR